MKNENIENKAGAAASAKDETAKAACKKAAAGTPRENIRGFKGLRALCFSALLCAAAVVIAYLCKALTIGNSIRITFENLPIILCGYAFGPIAGLLCGACADFLNPVVRDGLFEWRDPRPALAYYRALLKRGGGK